MHQVGLQIDVVMHVDVVQLAVGQQQHRTAIDPQLQLALPAQLDRVAQGLARTEGGA
jgi:hypothetical protein